MPGPLQEVLVWTTLTAATIGPGTVVLCSRSGSEQHASLLWCVIFAAMVAWILQEAAGRLTLSSNLTLSECMRMLSPRGRSATLRQLLVAVIVAVSLACEANNLIGAVAGISLLASSEAGEAAVRAVLDVVLAPACIVMLLKGGSTERLGLVLTGLVVAMLVCFSATIVGVGLPAGLLAGLVPSIPEGAAPLALSLIGTTAVPLNLLLGSSIAKASVTDAS